jgi:nitrite reductase/ring-hydroxylating ferredoxin subunit/alkylhydroperoxidase/carboxymuconolactone decarboxylase family protein YurZ
MSKALDYLLAARPEAMHNYFGFLKAAGQHLDPKTRAIISVITKVENQTEKGFRQYLNRALREGATANEILDALLVAFPTLGLTKIIWAVEQLIEMDLQEFKLENLNQVESWHDIAFLPELAGAGVKGLRCDGKTLFLKYDGTDYRVYDGVCPHQSTPIPIDALDGMILTCPKHQWKFDLGAGNCIAGGDRPLKILDLRIAADHLFAYW